MSCRRAASFVGGSPDSIRESFALIGREEAVDAGVSVNRLDGLAKAALKRNLQRPNYGSLVVRFRDDLGQALDAGRQQLAAKLGNLGCAFWPATRIAALAFCPCHLNQPALKAASATFLPLFFGGCQPENG